MGAWAGKRERPYPNMDHARSLERVEVPTSVFGSDRYQQRKELPSPPAHAFVSIRNLGEFRAATERTSASFSLCLLQPFYEDGRSEASRRCDTSATESRGDYSGQSRASPIPAYSSARRKH